MQHAWKELQAHLAEARARSTQGEFDQALQQVELALAIDPEYLAAKTLRERIIALKNQPPPPAGVVDIAPYDTVGVSAPAPAFFTTGQGMARFEERARQRRIEKRKEAARAAIADLQLGSARAALNELHELDPDQTELDVLQSQLDHAERQLAVTAATPGHGRWLAAGVAFGMVLLGAGWIERDTSLSRTRPRAANAVAEAQKAVIDGSPRVAGVFGLIDPAPSLAMADLVSDEIVPPLQVGNDRLGPPPAAPAAATPAAAAPPVVAPAQAAVASEPPPPIALSTSQSFSQSPSQSSSPAPSLGSFVASPTLAVAAPVTPVNLPIAAPPVAADVALPAVQPRPIPAAFTMSDDRLVRDALQQYRVAYDGLNAKSAKTVWPGVDEPALERAFQGLSSQKLTFETCDVHVNGVLATATCQGTARYTTKIGSRDPHDEARVWNFTLRKVDARWQIDSARVAR